MRGNQRYTFYNDNNNDSKDIDICRRNSHFYMSFILLNALCILS